MLVCLVSLFIITARHFTKVVITKYHRGPQSVATCVWDSQVGRPARLLSAICWQLEQGLVSSATFLQQTTTDLTFTYKDTKCSISPEGLYLTLP